MSSWEELQKADDLIAGLRAMDTGEQSSKDYDVKAGVEQVGVRSIHYLWGVNQLARMHPELKEHLQTYSKGFLMQALQETIRVLTEEVGGYRKHDLLIQYNMHDIE